MMEETGGKMILVVGSTGLVGSEICRLLAEKGLPFRALVRAASDPAKVERIKGYGAELVQGDLRDPASLKAACEGASVVINTVSAMPFSYIPGENDLEKVDRQGVMDLIDAAKAAGVSHFIDLTFSGNLERDFPLCSAKRAVEKHLQDSGMTYTIARPSMFMEVWLSPALGFDAANAAATVYGSGDQKITWISFRDVAALMVESLENPAARNAVLELGGPEMLTPHEVIRIFEAASGRHFDVIYVPPEALQAQYDGAVDPMQKSFVGLMQCYVKGDPIDMVEIQKAFAARLTSLKEFVAGVMTPA
jgi:NADH dehydrogenase